MTVIKVENLSKVFAIGHRNNERYLALRDILALKFKNMFTSMNATEIEEFWALRDVSFEVRQGERVGIIGRNGAGKSTLLKILSRIVEPTKGRVRIKGRMASLLEVGTGFHPELTGRENIFLNGAILGMTRREILNRFDEIVAFAGVERFLETPVKRYSSGMYVRLAFAIAAHLEPEILIVDEVLAVGDAEFQRKCLGKMKEVSSEGRTVLFVSHNMLAVKSLCTKAILLDGGVVSVSGDVNNVVQSYYDSLTGKPEESYSLGMESGGITITGFTISNNGVPGIFFIDENLIIEVAFVSSKFYETVNVNLFFKGQDDTVIFATCSDAEPIEVGKYVYTCSIPKNTLNDMVYMVDLMIVGNGPIVIHNLSNVTSIEGVERSRDSAWLGKFPGLIRPLYFGWSKRQVL